MTFQFNSKQFELCKKYIMQVYEGEGIIELNKDLNTVDVDEKDMEDFKDAADYAIIHFGMVNQDYLTPLGCKLQWLYDEIYYQTKQQK